MAEERKVLLRLENIKMHFPLKKKDAFQREKRYVRAVDGVTIDIYEGETFGLVGESGCGKSTLGRVILQLYNQTAGEMLYTGVSVDDYAPAYVISLARDIAGIRDSAPGELISRHRSAVRLAGGLLALQDRREVSSALEAKYAAVAKQNKIEYAMGNLRLKRGALETNGGDRAKEQRYDAQIKKYEDSLKLLYAQTSAREATLAELRKKAASLPGFKELEAVADHSVDLSKLDKEEMRRLRRDLQMVFQDPYSSLNPRLTVGQLIAEALVAHNMFKRGTRQMEHYTLDIMEKCGLQKYMLHRYPHQFSGGQRQRIGIARSLALRPKFVVCDEAVSALDVSIQSQIINLLVDLKEQDKLTYLFISHDLSAVKFISDRIGVMYLGNIIELGDADIIFSESLHPYTEALLDAIPTTEDEANKELQVIEGDIPSPINPPSGCKFHTRCKYAKENCKTVAPEWREWRKGHFVACHYPLKESDV